MMERLTSRCTEFFSFTFPSSGRDNPAFDRSQRTRICSSLPSSRVILQQRKKGDGFGRCSRTIAQWCPKFVQKQNQCLTTSHSIGYILLISRRFFQNLTLNQIQGSIIIPFSHAIYSARCTYSLSLNYTTQ